jgi:hypothetical protein
MEAHAIPFTYSETQLNACASYLLNESTHLENGIQPCHDLFVQHAAHYGRPPLSDEELLYWNQHGIESAMEAPSKRIRAFLDSVKFVHRHNRLDGHTVGLNRFSDLAEDELPFSNAAASSSGSINKKDNKSNWSQELEALSQKAFIEIDSEELIMELGAKIRRTAQYSTTQSQEQSTSSTSYSFLRQIMSLLHKPSYYTGLFDSWWWIGERHDNQSPQQTTAQIEEHTHHTSSSHSASKQTQGNSFVIDKKNEMDGIEEDENAKEDEWVRYLNWATEDNPDGVGIVHEAMDQV